MLPVHRIGDARVCGASTVPASGTGLERRVFVNGQIISLMGDHNTHGGGALTATTTKTFVNGLPIARLGDEASPDNLCILIITALLGHCNPKASTGSPNVFIGF
jgi:uncharacterized Zn-binding protein involved in type VI secretion